MMAVEAIRMEAGLPRENKGTEALLKDKKTGKVCYTLGFQMLFPSIPSLNTFSTLNNTMIAL